MYSISPSNEKFEIPDNKKTVEEISIIKNLCKQERNNGKEIVVVIGLGYVGAVVAAVIADCEINDKNPYFVLGVDIPSKESYWKIAKINYGKSPFNVADPEVEKIFERTVNKKKNLKATWVKEAYTQADILLIDINLDVIKNKMGNARKFKVDIDSFKKVLRDIGDKINPKSLILIETSVPPGTTKKIIQPILNESFIKRKIDLNVNPPLIAHSYERVMPGKNYVKSINEIWRTFSANNEIALKKARKFLSNIIDTKNYPLWEFNNTNSSELGKVLENSYRAMNIAFIYEWTLLAEDMGVNLFEIVDSIKIRKGTHDNMMYPGFGVGGYCLPKDPLLAEWSSKFLYNRKVNLNLTLDAVNINDLMPHHVFELVKKGLDDDLNGKKIAILGASYRKDVDDTRNSPTITLYNEIKKADGIPIVQDPYANKIEGENDIKIENDVKSAIKGASAVVFAVNHKHYENLPMATLISNINKDSCVIDAFNVLTDEKIKNLKKNDIKVLGVGKGHIKYL